MASIAIIAPDGNRVVGISSNVLPLHELARAKFSDPRVRRESSVDTSGDWPFKFDRVYVCERSAWRGYDPDDLPMAYWYI